MEKKILLAVDDSIHTKQAMQYAVRISSDVSNLWFTLFFVQPAISQYLLEEADKSLKAKAELKKKTRKNHDAAQRILDTLKNQLVRMGIPENRIDLHTQPKILGLAKDIMDRAQQGHYDAIVVGRRGLSKVQKAVLGSVTATLIEHAAFIPVWIVDGEVSSSKIMLAVDGSESSLRAVDHLCFMVGENPNVKITIFHAHPAIGEICQIDFGDQGVSPEVPIPKGARGCIDRFYAHAWNMFVKAGIAKDRIDIKVSRKVFHVGRAIINEAKRGDYGTVVVGRRGANKAFFMGSVSRQVIDRATKRALWIVS